jgi:hypothetical protein
MEKQLENPEKKKKPKQPKPAHPAQRGHAPARPCRLTGERHLSAAVSSPTRSLSPSLCPVGPGCRRQFPLLTRPSSLSALRARFARRRVVAPHTRSLSLAARGTPISSAFPAPRRGRACALADVAGILGHVGRPRPQPIFEHCSRPLSLPCPISHSPTLSRALPTPLSFARDPRPPCRSSSSSEAMPSNPELRPEVRHPFPCLVFPICACL